MARPPVSACSVAAVYEARAQRTEDALLERCWDPRRGLFWDLAGRRQTPLEVSTWSSLSPLARPSLPREIAVRPIEEHRLDPRRYRASYGIPSVSMDEPSFRAGWHLFGCWRGPSWMNSAWLLVPALRRHGYGADAERIVAGCVELGEKHGFREYYNPLNGGGLAARRFGWSTLLVHLLPRTGELSADAEHPPYQGSVRDELLAMRTEAAAETYRRLGNGAAPARAPAKAALTRPPANPRRVPL